MKGGFCEGGAVKESVNKRAVHILLQCILVHCDFNHSASPLLLTNARQRSCGTVMFSAVSVCHTVQGGGPHVTITHDAFYLTV